MAKDAARMPVTYSNPGDLAEPLSTYSHLASGSGRLVSIAGQVALDRNGDLVGRDDCAAQVVQTFENIRLALAAGDLRPQNLLQLTTYLVDADHIPAFYDARAMIFVEMFPNGRYPPNTLLVIDRLVHPEMLVEVSALAVAPT
jgi:enamine deaminase RidA (YjgF/YER057c/UK114 family)